MQKTNLSDATLSFYHLPQHKGTPPLAREERDRRHMTKAHCLRVASELLLRGVAFTVSKPGTGGLVALGFEDKHEALVVRLLAEAERA